MEVNDFPRNIEFLLICITRDFNLFYQMFNFLKTVSLNEAVADLEGESKVVTPPVLL